MQQIKLLLYENGEEQRITQDSLVTVFRNHELVAGWEEMIKTPCNPPTVSVEGEIVEGIIGESEWIVVGQGSKIVLNADAQDTIYYAFLNSDGDPEGDYQEYTEAIPVTAETRIGIYTARPEQSEFYSPSDVRVFCFKLYFPKAYISYVISHGMNHEENVMEYQIGETVSLKDAIPETGYLFEGWYRDSAYQNCSDSVLSTDTQDLTFYAKIVPITYQMVYCSNDGKADTVTSVAVYDRVTTLKNNQFQREGYEFAGWNTKADGTGVAYREGQPVINLTTVAGDIIYLYAQWTEVTEEMKGFRVKGVEPEYTFTGSAIKPELKVFDGIKELTEKKDYKVIYKNNKNAGNATVIVRGSGNYKGEIITGFVILPIDITDEEFNADNLSVTYNKKAQKPMPALYIGNKKLSAKKDYFVQYFETELVGTEYQRVGEPMASVKEPGHYKVCIIGKGNYVNQREIDLSIAEKEMSLVSKCKISKIGSLEYTGGEICPKPLVKYKNTILEEGVHYTLRYHHNTQIGTAAVIVEGMEENGYSGTKRINFVIKGRTLNKNNIWEMASSYEYTGTKMEPFGAVGDNADPGWASLWFLPDGEEELVSLVKGNDYEVVSYKNNCNAGTATVVLKGINQYSGTITAKFKIQPAKVADEEIEVSYPSIIPYAKGGAAPEVQSVTVKMRDLYGNQNTQVLVPEKDYTVVYQNNKTVTTGTTTKLPTIIIKGKGNYSGVLATETFEIVPQDISSMKISAKDKVYNGRANNYKTSLEIIDEVSGKKLDKKDYDTNLKYYYDQDTVVEIKQKKETLSVVRERNTEVQKTDLIPVGTVLRVETQGINGYYGEVIATYRVTAGDFTKAKVKIKDQEYTGRQITITYDDILEVKVGGVELEPSDYRIVGCSNDINKGKATVILEGTGDYGGCLCG